MTSEEKNGPEKRQGLEAKNSVEDSLQKFTNKVLPGIFSKTGQKMSISSEKQLDCWFIRILYCPWTPGIGKTNHTNHNAYRRAQLDEMV